MSTLTSSRVIRLTPSCQNLSNSVKTVGYFLLAVAILTFIALIVSAIYANYSDTSDTPNSRATSSGITVSIVLQVICIIMSVVVAAIAGWHVVIANKFVACSTSSAEVR